MIYWCYGQPGDGKTTLANALNLRINAIQDDGDEVRSGFNKKD